MKTKRPDASKVLGQVMESNAKALAPSPDWTEQQLEFTRPAGTPEKLRPKMARPVGMKRVTADIPEGLRRKVTKKLASGPDEVSLSTLIQALLELWESDQVTPDLIDVEVRRRELLQKAAKAFADRID